jgi:hypothetical protein
MEPKMTGSVLGSRLERRLRATRRASTAAPTARSAAMPLGERAREVIARAPADDRTDERLALVILLAVACGIPLLSRRRSADD